MGKRELVNQLEQLLRPYRKEVLALERKEPGNRNKPAKLLVERVLADLRTVFIEALAQGEEVHLTKIATIRPKLQDDGSLTIECKLKRSFVAEAVQELTKR